VTAKDKLDADFHNLNLKVERTAQEEINRIRSDLNALKNQAANMQKTGSLSSSNEEKRG
jgi:hypothetical protein